MNISDAILINTKKLKFRTGKSLFLIIPVAILVGLSFIISSQVKNVRTALDEGVFSKIEDESTVLKVAYQADTSERGFGFMLSSNVFTEADLEKVLSLDHVDAADMYTNLPISLISTNDLFDNVTLSLRNVSTLGSDMSGIYTTDDFEYTDGEPIPIILNANSFMETYEDWAGEDTITIDFQTMMQDRPEPGGESSTIAPGGGLMSLSPMKTRAIEYDEDDIVGKEFTMTFGGFSDVSTVNTSRSENVITFSKKTDEEISAAESERKASIDTYWNYDMLASGNTYTFVVVGIVKEDDFNAPSAYVPVEFANKAVDDYLSLAVESQVADVPTDLLNSTYTGLTYDGLELAQSGGGLFISGGARVGSGTIGIAGPGPREMGFQPDSDDTDGSSSYEIPGLVILLAQDDGSVEGVSTDTTLFESSVKTGDTIYVKVDRVNNRGTVIAAINDAGYAYQDLSNLDAVYSVQSTLEKISTWLVAGFVVLNVAVIVLTMSKFVSDSRKEIGIFRAVGFTKKNILSIFLLQSLLYTAVGYVIGVVVGFIGNLLVSPVLAGWFDSFLENTIAQTYAVVSSVDHTVFSRLDVISILMLSGVLLLITVVVSFIPAYTASCVSPVEAIRNE
jgi:ABC-type antimicrobial peptide transport system permease subunit